MSLFITFEGGEGSGKSTQTRMLYQRLLALNIPAVLTREPGGTPLGEEIARLLKWKSDVEIPVVAELLLFNASRAQLAADVIKPALESNKVVVSDRYTDSTTAYQGYGGGLPLETIRLVNDIASSRLSPDLTVLIDVPVAVGFERIRNEKRDRFEQKEVAFHERVRQGFLEMARDEPRRFLVIDGTDSIEKVKGLIWDKVASLLISRGYKVKP